jgi:hypothetical protein
MNARKIKAAVADISADTDPTRKAAKLASLSSKPKAPSIPIARPLAWEDWLRGRRARREISKKVAPGVVRRSRSSSDRRLRKLFKGRRGLPFTPTEKL